MTVADFKNTVLPTYGAMRAIAFRMLGDMDEASDVVQDVFRNMWEKHESLDIKGNVSVYVLTSVRNSCINVIRYKKNSYNIESLKDTESFDVADEDDDKEHQRRIELLLQSIDALNDPAKSVMRLSLLGRGSAEIAGELEISETNVRQILSRTRKKLKTILVEKR